MFPTFSLPTSLFKVHLDQYILNKHNYYSVRIILTENSCRSTVANAREIYENW